MSLNVISPTSFFCLLTIGNFSILCFWRIISASFIEIPSCPVTKLFFDIIWDKGFLFSFSNLKSLFVTIPISFFSLSTIGIPPILYSFIKLLAFETNAVWYSVTGSKIIPDSDLLTFFTLSACISIGILLCITPNPPSWAMPMAILLSVTVSIAAETIGIFKLIFFENLVFKFTWLGKISEYAGTNKTSSYVRPMPVNLFWRFFIAINLSINCMQIY